MTLDHVAHSRHSYVSLAVCVSIPAQTMTDTRLLPSVYWLCVSIRPLAYMLQIELDGKNNALCHMCPASSHSFGGRALTMWHTDITFLKAWVSLGSSSIFLLLLLPMTVTQTS
jgi:hypothetical protein